MTLTITCHFKYSPVLYNHDTKLSIVRCFALDNFKNIYLALSLAFDDEPEQANIEAKIYRQLTIFLNNFF